MRSKTGHLLIWILIFVSSAVSCQFSNPLKTNDDDRELAILNEMIMGSNTIHSFDLALADNPGKGLTADIHGIVGDGTVELYVPFGTDTTGLVPTIRTSMGSITPGSGVPHDFPDGIGQTYTLTSMYMTTRDWVVTLHAGFSSSKDIAAFYFTAADNASSGITVDVIGTIGTDTVDLYVPYGTDTTALVPTIAITGTTVTPGSGVAQSFPDGVGRTYRVTAADTSTKTYTVTVHVLLDTSKEITSFVFTAADNSAYGITADVTGTIAANTVYIEVPNGTNTAALVPTITITGTSVSPPSGTAHSFPDGVAQTYTVTAADSTTQDYAVTVHVLPKVAQPSIAPNGGTFTGSQTATIACATPGATIMYTTDGSDPRSSATRTAGTSVFVSMPMSIRAYAYAPGYTDSDETASIPFDIVSGIVFVSTAGDDANQGTILFPKRTIPAGITLADTHFALGEVRVAMGTYDSGADMTVANGISLYGAYNADFSSRDLALNDTVIYNTRTTGASNILLYNGITSDTVIDGFIIRSAPSAGGGVNSISATNCNNKLIIRNNTIEQTTGAGSAGLVGIYCLTSSPYIYNNVIFGGSSAGRTMCIYARNGSNAYVYNNTLVAGTGTASHYVFQLRYDAVAVCHLTLVNNLLIDPTADSTGLPGLYHMDAGTGNTPVCYTTNLFYNDPPTGISGEYIYYSGGNTNNIQSTNYTTRAAITSANGTQLLTYVNPNWSNIVNADPQFTNLAFGDYHLQATSPALGAGTNLSGSFTTDRDGNPRPGAGAWSIGAYE